MGSKRALCRSSAGLLPALKRRDRPLDQLSLDQIGMGLDQKPRVASRGSDEPIDPPHQYRLPDNPQFPRSRSSSSAGAYSQAEQQ